MAQHEERRLLSRRTHKRRVSGWIVKGECDRAVSGWKLNRLRMADQPRVDVDVEACPHDLDAPGLDVDSDDRWQASAAPSSGIEHVAANTQAVAESLRRVLHAAQHAVLDNPDLIESVLRIQGDDATPGREAIATHPELPLWKAELRLHAVEHLGPVVDHAEQIPPAGTIRHEVEHTVG